MRCKQKGKYLEILEKSFSFEIHNIKNMSKLGKAFWVEYCTKIANYFFFLMRREYPVSVIESQLPDNLKYIYIKSLFLNANSWKIAGQEVCGARFAPKICTENQILVREIFIRKSTKKNKNVLFSGPREICRKKRPDPRFAKLILHGNLDKIHRSNHMAS